ncbi:MAG: 3-hydroxyacyl-CoA dehydrogenase NAD-binding domain-containing protein [Gemmatimonadota bacterium]
MGALTVTMDRGIAVVSIDLPGEPVNKLGPGMLAEFETLLFDALGPDSAVRGVVLISGKPDTFIAGADIDQFLAIKTAEDGTRLAGQGHDLLNRVEAFPKPIVSAVHGACVGLGLELSLACPWIVATDHPKTVLGLPEVQIGILPASGGCQRLPRKIGLRAALDIILAGKSERAAKAFRLGIVDELVHPAILRETAIKAALRLADSGKPRPRRGGGLLLDRNPLGRRLVYSQARKMLLKKTGGHYPAPLAALEAIRAGLEGGMEAGLRVERIRFGELAVSEVARQLIGIFFATTALKKDDAVPPGTASRTVKRLGIIGSGFMGSGIAGTAVSQAGVEVRLKDADLQRVGKGLFAARSIVDGRLKRRSITRYEHTRVAALLSGTGDYSGFPGVDLVIEAVFEDLEVKRGVMAELEAVVGPDTVLATNTSTIPIGQIAARARHPERILGMHFFSPVDRMPLLEVIPAQATSHEAIATAVRFGRRMGKTVIVVADSPGFWVNRILAPYMNEAGILISEGVPFEVIDRAMTRFGFPVGPVTLLDEVGLDVARKVGGVMLQALGERLKAPDVIARMTEDGRMGRKNGRGFYLYRKGKKSGVDESAYRVIGVEPLTGSDEATVQRRLAYAMLNEAALGMAEGLVRSPRDGDIGAIFGIGFPPFRGGPLRMIDALGPAEVVKTLEDLVRDFGDRFTPAAPLVEMARRADTFYR